MCLEYEAVKRAYNQLRAVDAEFAEEVRREVVAIIDRAKRTLAYQYGGGGGAK